MAFSLKLSSLSDEHKELIENHCVVTTKATIYDPEPMPHLCYKINYQEDSINLPFGLWKNCLNEEHGFPNGNADEYPPMNPSAKFTKELLTIETDPDKRGRDQDVIVAQALHKLYNDGSVFMSLHTGAGKCLSYGTKILMYNGEKKEVQNIQPGELIMGDDSTPRTILSTCEGEEEMYEIALNKGESFTVNKSHILTLKFTSYGRIRKRGNSFDVMWFDGTTTKSKVCYSKNEADIFVSQLPPNVFDIPLEKYLTLGKNIKTSLKSFWCPVNYAYQEITLDPYFLGLWLGDGNSSCPKIVTVDKEIGDFLVFFAKEENVNIHIHHRKDRNHIMDYSMSSKEKGRKNHVLNKMKKLNLIKNKHIPLEYKANSREVRLQLLAGFIDTDGYYKDGTYEIIQKRKNLTDDLQDICRSLGFGCFTSECKKGCPYKGEYREGTYYRLKFSGVGIEDIPVLLPRKKATPRRQIKDPLVTSFKVVPKGVGKYYGFMIDGNKRFLLGTHMVTHNTGMAIYLSIKLGLKTMVLCHLDIVKSQWPDEYDKFSDKSVKVQYVKGKAKLDPDADVYIMGIIKAGHLSDDELMNIGTVIIDEAHISISAAFTETLLKFRPRFLIALSATYDRLDGLHRLFYPYFGQPSNFIIRKEKKPFTVYKVYTPFEPIIKYKRKNGEKIVDWTKVINSIESNPIRWQMIVDIVLKYPEHKMIILCNRQIQSKGIYDLLIQCGESAELLISKKKEWDKTKRVLVAGFKKGGVGLNDPSLNFAIIASDTQDVRQYEGRIRTTNNIIYHIVDYYSAFEKHYKVCEKWYKDKGATIEEINYINF